MPERDSSPPADQADPHREDVARAYSGYARSGRKRKAWAAGNPGNVAIRRELLDQVLRVASREIGGRGRILDLGCGSGWWLQALIGQGVDPARLAGVEIQPARVRAAREAATGAEVTVGDVTSLAFADDSFELVLLFTVLSSLGSRERVRQALGEARRVLAPGGLLLVYEPRVANPFNRSTLLLRDADLDRAGVAERRQVSLTLLPWLARRLGGATPGRYAALSRIPPLRTHRLIVHRAPGRGA